MNIRRFLFITWIAAFVIVLFAGVILHQRNQKISRLIDDEHERQARFQTERSHQMEAAATAQNRALHEELIKARLEVMELERKADGWHAKKVAEAAKDAAALAANQDPTQGLVFLGNFRDRGRATPSEGFQTFVWAVTQGDAEIVSTFCLLDDVAEESAKAIIDEMPEADRRNWTSQKLACLFFQAKLSQYTAAQITGIATIDAQSVTLKIRAPGKPHEDFPMRSDSSGWKMLVSRQQITALRSKIPLLLAGEPVELP